MAHSIMHVLLGSLLATMQGQVLVVDSAGGPGSQFTTLVAAIDAAQDGDTLLVRDGVYLGGYFPFLAKSLTVVAETGAHVRVDTFPIVSGLTAEQSLTVRGLEFQGVTVIATNSQGPIVFDQCAFVATGRQTGLHALELRDCESVTLSHCLVDWTPIPEFFFAYTVNTLRSNWYLYETQIFGPDSGFAFEAVNMTDGFAFLSGSSVLGGDGVPGLLAGPTGCTSGGAGGAAMELHGTATVEVLDSVVLGGPGGASLDPEHCPDGPAGAAFELHEQASVSTTPGNAVSFESSSPVRGGQSATRTYEAAANDPVWLLYADAPMTPFSATVFDAFLHLDFFSLCGEFVGTVPASGALVQSVPVPVVVGLPSLIFHAQPMVLSQAGRLVLGSPSVVVILDPTL